MWENVEQKSVEWHFSLVGYMLRSCALVHAKTEAAHRLHSCTPNQLTWTCKHNVAASMQRIPFCFACPQNREMICHFFFQLSTVFTPLLASRKHVFLHDMIYMIMPHMSRSIWQHYIHTHTQIYVVLTEPGTLTTSTKNRRETVEISWCCERNSRLPIKDVPGEWKKGDTRWEKRGER